MKVIHLGTTVIPEFGVIDDNGNLVNNITVTAEGNKNLKISVFSADAFQDVFNNLVKTKSELEAKVENLKIQAPEGEVINAK
jgi:hypothetical protein